MRASAQVVELSVSNNSPSQDSNHPDDLFQSRLVTHGFKPFSQFLTLLVRLPPNDEKTSYTLYILQQYYQTNDPTL